MKNGKISSECPPITATWSRRRSWTALEKTQTTRTTIPHYHTMAWIAPALTTTRFEWFEPEIRSRWIPEKFCNRVRKNFGITNTWASPKIWLACDRSALTGSISCMECSSSLSSPWIQPWTHPRNSWTKPLIKQFFSILDTSVSSQSPIHGPMNCASNGLRRNSVIIPPKKKRYLVTSISFPIGRKRFPSWPRESKILRTARALLSIRSSLPKPNLCRRTTNQRKPRAVHLMWTRTLSAPVFEKSTGRGPERASGTMWRWPPTLETGWSLFTCSTVPLCGPARPWCAKSWDSRGLLSITTKICMGNQASAIPVGSYRNSRSAPRHSRRIKRRRKTRKTRKWNEMKGGGAKTIH